MKNFKRQGGFSLVELMIAMVIGLVLTGAVLQMFLASRVTYSTQNALAQLQENGRFAMEFLSRDLRQAGFRGCTNETTMVNTLLDTGGLQSFTDLSVGIGGNDNLASTVTYEEDPVDGTDSIEIRFASADNSCSVASHNPSAASIHCEANNDLKKGQVLVITDCSHTAVFQKSDTNNNGTKAVLVHNTGNATPGNCTKGLGAPLLCTTNGTAYAFPPGSSVMEMKAYRYYIANNSFGQPALYREGIQVNTNDLAQEELVEGVEDMQVRYGEDANGDGAADYYVPADHVSDMGNVVSIRVSLLLRSTENGVVPEAQTYTYNGSTVTATDRRLRKVFTSTIALRNRL